MTDQSSVDGKLREFRAEEMHKGWRLDHFLAKSLPELSRSRLQALIAEGRVAHSEATIRDPNRRVKPGESYAIVIPPPAPASPQPQDIPLSILYEDADLIVIDKPAGLVVHPAAGNLDGTLVNALLAHCGKSLAGIGGVARPGIVHRLDKDTSGVLVAAKTERAMRSLAKQFAAHAVERVYNAVVWGAPRGGEGVVEFAIIAAPFMLLLIGTLSVCLYFFTNFTMENAVWSAARAIRTGEVQQSQGSYAGAVTTEDRKNAFKAAMCAKAPSFLDCPNRAVVLVQSSSTFGTIVEPTCASNGTMIDQSAATFTPGEASAVVLVTVCYSWQFGGKLPLFKIGNLNDGSLLMQASAAFRTEPYN